MNREKIEQRDSRDERLAAAHRTGQYQDEYCFKPEPPPDPLPSFLDALNQRRANRGQPPLESVRKRRCQQMGARQEIEHAV